jgi:hypothetical protein
MASFNLIAGEGGHNYTGILTRSIVFSGALIAFLASMSRPTNIRPDRRKLMSALATGLTLASIIVPNWISFENHTVRGYLPPKSNPEQLL